MPVPAVQRIVTFAQSGVRAAGDFFIGSLYLIAFEQLEIDRPTT